MSVRRRVALLFVAAIVVATIAPPVAATGPAARRAADAKAYHGRLIVVWRGEAPKSVRLDNVKHVSKTARPMRNVVTAKKGHAADVAAALRRDPRVMAVVPDARLSIQEWPADGSPNDPYFFGQSNLQALGVPEAWKTTTGDPSVVVAVIDSGVDVAHPDLYGVDIVNQYDAVDGTADIADPYGHGTHVAGAIFARTDNGIGMSGIAPDVALMPIKVADEYGDASLSGVMDGIDWAAAHGADVINMSVGGYLSKEEIGLFQSVVDGAHESGALLVAAAGNDASAERLYPASLNHVISVAATDPVDRAASFSQHNSAVDVAAPGVAVLSTILKGEYDFWSGTSMATSQVSGAAALLLAHRPELAPDEAEAILRTTARDVATPGYDIYTGDGIVNAAAALDAVVPDPLPELDPPSLTEFMVSFASPAANTVIEDAEFDFEIVASMEPVDTAVVAVYWRSPGNRCPSFANEDYFTYAYLDYAPVVPVTGITDSVCVRVYVGALNKDGYYAEAYSAAVIGADHTAPRITRRSPRVGQTGYPVGRTLRIQVSEKILGVSPATVRLRNVETGRIVKARVWFNAKYREIRIDPAWDLRHNRTYQVEILPGLTDLVGNPLARSTWRFKTIPW